MSKKKFTEDELKGKYVIAFDTICDGEQCVFEGKEGTDERKPVLYDSEDEAWIEIFGDALSKLDNYEEDELEEFTDGVTKEMLDEMNKIWENKNVEEMKKFFDKYPECNDYDEYPVKAEEFILGRKAFFTGNGGHITGTPLNKL